MNPEIREALIQMLAVAQHPALRQFIVDLLSGESLSLKALRERLPDDARFSVDGAPRCDEHVDSLLIVCLDTVPFRDFAFGQDEELQSLGLLEAAKIIRRHAPSNP